MFVVIFPEHYSEAMRWGVLSLFVLIQFCLYFIWFGSITLTEKVHAFIRRNKGVKQSCSASDLKMKLL